MKRLTRIFKIVFVLLTSTMILGSLLVSCSKDETKTNNAPVISSIVINPSTIGVGGVVTITVIASDADHDELSYSYSPNGGAISGSGPTVSWTAPSLAGTYSVTVKVTDGKTTTEQSSALTVTGGGTSSTITGRAYFPAGVSGDLSNAKVSLYTSLDNWTNNTPIRFVATVGTGSSVTFTLTNVLPGNYYLDVWKDIDNNAFWTKGDFVGWYGAGGLGSPSLTELQVTQGQTVNVNVDMYIIP